MEVEEYPDISSFPSFYSHCAGVTRTHILFLLYLHHLKLLAVTYQKAVKPL